MQTQRLLEIQLNLRHPYHKSIPLIVEMTLAMSFLKIESIKCYRFAFPNKDLFRVSKIQITKLIEVIICITLFQ